MSLPQYYKEERPWGYFERFTENEVSTVKILALTANKRFSLQRHRGRKEFWRVLSGSGTATINDAEIPLSPGSEIVVEIGDAHRLTAGPEGLQVLEIMFGHYDENDNERLEDDFGRV